MALGLLEFAPEPVNLLFLFNKLRGNAEFERGSTGTRHAMVALPLDVPALAPAVFNPELSLSPEDRNFS